MKAQEIGEYLTNFQIVCPAKHDADYLGIASAKEIHPDHLVFVKNKKFLKHVQTSELPQGNLGFIFDEKLFAEVKEELVQQLPDQMLATVVNVDEGISRLSRPFYDKKNKNRNDVVDGRQMGTVEIHPTANIAQNVFLGEGVKIHGNVMIHSGCVILAGSEIGEGSVLYPNVTLYRDTKLGQNCRIHSGVVIGSDGYGYNFVGGKHLKVWHVGGTEIGNEVEIGANSCVDMGAFVPTRIGDGTKIDNSVQIGHNCQIGRHVIICGTVGVAGSTSIGDYTVIGGGAGIGPDLSIGSQCQIAGHAGVNTSWPDKSVIGGHPARPVKEWLRGVAFVRKESLRGK